MREEEEEEDDHGQNSNSMFFRALMKGRIGRAEMDIYDDLHDNEDGSKMVVIIIMKSTHLAEVFTKIGQSCDFGYLVCKVPLQSNYVIKFKRCSTWKI